MTTRLGRFFLLLATPFSNRPLLGLVASGQFGLDSLALVLAPACRRLPPLLLLDVRQRVPQPRPLLPGRRRALNAGRLRSLAAGFAPLRHRARASCSSTWREASSGRSSPGRGHAGEADLRLLQRGAEPGHPRPRLPGGAHPYRPRAGSAPGARVRGGARRHGAAAALHPGRRGGAQGPGSSTGHPLSGSTSVLFLLFCSVPLTDRLRRRRPPRRSTSG